MEMLGCRAPRSTGFPSLDGTLGPRHPEVPMVGVRWKRSPSALSRLTEVRGSGFVVLERGVKKINEPTQVNGKLFTCRDLV